MSSSRMVGPAVLALALALAGCSDEGDGDTEVQGVSAEAVDITLADYSVTPDPTSVASGDVQFRVTNDAEQVHEFVVAQTDLGADELPTGEGGDVEEAGAEDLEVVDEIEDVEGGTEETLDVTLDPGHYVLFCNLPGHYAQGMTIDFEVTDGS